MILYLHLLPFTLPELTKSKSSVVQKISCPKGEVIKHAIDAIKGIDAIFKSFENPDSWFSKPKFPDSLIFYQDFLIFLIWKWMFRKLLYFPFKTCWDIVTRIIKSIKNCADFTFEVGRFEIRKCRRKVACVLPELLRFVNTRAGTGMVYFEHGSGSSLGSFWECRARTLQKARKNGSISKSRRR